MAIKGLSIPVCGTYQADGNTVTYSDPFIADDAVEYSIALESTEDNPLYASNKIKENDQGKFKSGTLTLGTSDLPQELSQKMIGIKIIKIKMGEKEISEGVYDEKQKSPELGFGIIELHQIDNVDCYRAVFLTRVMFKIPEEAATTKGETVNWQTRSITASILRSDHVDENYVHPWMMDAWFETEEEALAYLKCKCGEAVTATEEGVQANG